MVPYVLVYFYSLVMSNMKMISEIRLSTFFESYINQQKVPSY